MTSIVFLTLGAAQLLGQPGEEPGRDPAQREALSAFAGREKAAMWFKARFTTQMTIKKGVTDVTPERDLSYEGKITISGGPGTLRLETEGYAYNAETKRLVGYKSTTVSDGKKLQNYEEDGERSYPLGTITDRNAEKTSSRMFFLQPLFLIFRPLASGMVDTTKLRPSVEQAFARDRPSLVFNDSRWTFWLDRNPPFHLLRVARVRNGMTLLQNDFFYEKGEFFPDRVESVTYTGGKQREACISHLRDLTLATLPAGEFDLVFPPGTVVRDLRERDPGKKTPHFVVRSDGTMKDITTDPEGAIKALAEGPRIGFWLTLVGVAILALGGYLIILRKGKRTAR